MVSVAVVVLVVSTELTEVVVPRTEPGAAVTEDAIGIVVVGVTEVGETVSVVPETEEGARALVMYDWRRSRGDASEKMVAATARSAKTSESTRLELKRVIGISCEGI